MDEIKLTKEEQNIIDSVKEVSLSMSEKNDIKNNLILYTNSHPISIPKKTSIFTFDYIYHRSVYLVPAIAVVLLVIGFNTTDNNSGQIASVETVDTNISDTVPTTEVFSTMSAPAGSIESASFAEPTMADEPSNTRMRKSVKAPVSEDSATMMMSATVEVATSTATTTLKSSSSIEKIKEQINTTYKSFISKIFSKNKKEDRKKEEAKEKKERKSKKEDDEDGDSKSKSTSVINDDKNSGVKELEIELEKVESEDDDDDEDRDDDNKYVIQPLPPVTPPANTTSNTTVASYTSTEVAKHSVSSDCWSIVSGGVYNLTSWIAKHPGGQSAIKGMCGVDATSGFLAQHNGDTKAVNTIASYKIGTLK